MNDRRRKLPEPMGPGSYADALRGPAFEARGYSVFSHSDDPVPGRSPADAILFVIHAALDGAPFNLAMRIKSRAAADELIDALERHAEDVWPKR